MTTHILQARHDIHLDGLADQVKSQAQYAAQALETLYHLCIQVERDTGKQLPNHEEIEKLRGIGHRIFKAGNIAGAFAENEAAQTALKPLQGLSGNSFQQQYKNGAIDRARRTEERLKKVMG